MKLKSFRGSESTHFHWECDGNVYGIWILAACKCKTQRVCEFSYSHASLKIASNHSRLTRKSSCFFGSKFRDDLGRSVEIWFFGLTLIVLEMKIDIHWRNSQYTVSFGIRIATHMEGWLWQLADARCVSHYKLCFNFILNHMKNDRETYKFDIT